MQWEEILPHNLAARWLELITSLTVLADIEVPRWMGTSNDHYTDKFLCDASKRAYRTAVNFRSSTREGFIVRLACSKNRFAPIKN